MKLAELKETAEGTTLITTDQERVTLIEVVELDEPLPGERQRRVALVRGEDRKKRHMPARSLHVLPPVTVAV